MKYDKIILTGTHHSGKTTIIEKYKDDYNVMDELIRALATQANFHFTPSNPEQYAFSELALVHFYYGMAKGVNLLDIKKPWLFDRCIIDPLYYIKYFNIDVRLSEGTIYNTALKLTTDLIQQGFFDNSLLLLMKPIPITKHDGFRLGETEQEGIYDIAIKTLQVLNVNYKIVTTKEAEEIIDNNLKLWQCQNDYGLLSI
jgi:GTPase SAR1 family protein